MMRITCRRGFLVVACLVLLTPSGRAEWKGTVDGAPKGWTVNAPREEIRPQFAFVPAGGSGGHGAFAIEHDNREGLDGGWVTMLPVRGGHWHHFHALRKVDHVPVPRRSAVAKITWLDAEGRRVRYDEAVPESYSHNEAAACGVGASDRQADRIRRAGPRFRTRTGCRPRLPRPWSNCGCSGRRAARSNGAT